MPALVGLVLLAGCQLEVQVGVDVADDGSGEVSVATALDAEAAAKVPDLADRLEVDDLLDAGWEVDGPTLEADGRTWVRAVKPFATPEDAGLVFNEISGAGGPFRDFLVRRTPTLSQDLWEFTGTVDLTQGLAGFSDDALRARLDGTDVGRSEAEIDEAVGGPLDEALSFRVAVALPGQISAAAPGVDGAGEGAAPGVAVWRPSLGERVALAATAKEANTSSLRWFALAAGAIVAAALATVVTAVRRRSMAGA